MQIEVKNVSKEYKIKKNPTTFSNLIRSMVRPEYEILRAVKDISFSIGKGEMVGYVGPNGSGKSTTIKMLCGVLQPTEGKISINNMDIRKDRKTINRKIGAVFGNRSALWWDVPVIESYRVLQNLYEIPESIFKKNLSEFTDILEMEKLLDIPERQLSLGQKMKCNIAAVFLHEPEIVYLDEPTIGLDSESKEKIRNFIIEMNQRKKTTFIITSHDFQDIESLSKRLILINHGEIIVDDKIDSVKQHFERKRKLILTLDKNLWLDNKPIALPGITVCMSNEKELVIEYETKIINSLSIITYINERTTIEDMIIESPDIEEIFRDIVKSDNKKRG